MAPDDGESHRANFNDRHVRTRRDAGLEVHWQPSARAGTQLGQQPVPWGSDRHKIVGEVPDSDEYASFSVGSIRAGVLSAIEPDEAGVVRFGKPPEALVIDEVDCDAPFTYTGTFQAAVNISGAFDDLQLT